MLKRSLLMSKISPMQAQALGLKTDTVKPNPTKSGPTKSSPAKPVAKAAAKPVVQTTVKTPVKVTVPVAKTASTVKAKPAATKPVAKTTAVKTASNKANDKKDHHKKDDKKDSKQDDKKPKSDKVKMERDSFTMPKDEYAQIALLKSRLTAIGQPAKKSELLRAGIKLLAAMSDNTLKTTLAKIPVIKTGRPNKKD